MVRAGVVVVLQAPRARPDRPDAADPYDPAVAAPGLVEVEPDRWDAELRRLGVADAYLAHGFVRASAALVDAAPVLLRLADVGGDVVFAALVREDPRDVVSPYGYGGPVALGKDPPIEAFGAAYADWCAARGVLTSFVVFHPLFGNDAHAARLGFRRVPLAGTVAWRLDEPDVRARMHKHHRRMVRRAEARRPRRTRHAVARRSGRVRRALRGRDAPPRRRAVLPLPAALLGRPCSATCRSSWSRCATRGASSPPPCSAWGSRPGCTTTSGPRGRRRAAPEPATSRSARSPSGGGEQGYGVLHLGGGVGGRADSLLEYKLPLRARRAARRRDGQGGARLQRPTRELTGLDDRGLGGLLPAYRAR